MGESGAIGGRRCKPSPSSGCDPRVVGGRPICQGFAEGGVGGGSEGGSDGPECRKLDRGGGFGTSALFPIPESGPAPELTVSLA